MRNEDSVNANILIDMDSLLDTRLPVLYALDKNTAIDVLKDEKYQKRVKDVFGNIAYNIFSSYYRNRTKDILKLATPTPFINVLMEYCVQAYNSVATEVTDSLPKLYINTYPYDLNNEEKGNLLMLLVKLLPVRINIDIIYMSNSELTPKFVANNVSIFIKYDMLEWLEYHNSIGELAKCPLLSTACIAPLLANGNKLSTELKQKDFDDLRAIFGPLTNLVMLQTRLFSIP